MKRETIALVSVAMGTLLIVYDGAAVQMVLPVLVQEFHRGIATVQWTMTAFMLFSTALLLPAGRAGDVLGRERVWQVGILLFVVASAFCSAMPGLWWLVGARAVQGTGAALASANAAALMVSIYPTSQRARALSIGNVAMAVGLVIGPPAGSLLTQVVSWRLIFGVAVPLGLVALRGARAHLPCSVRAAGALDLPGGVLSTLALAGLLVGGTFGDQWGWISGATLAALALGGAAAAGLLLWESGTRHALLDLRLFSGRPFLSGALASMFGYAALFTLTLTMPFFLLVAQRRGLLAAGLIVGVVPLALSILAPVAAWIADARGARGIATVGLLGIGAGLLLLQLARPDTGTGLLIVGLGLAGGGLGAFEAPNDSAVLGSLPDERLGVGTATLGAMRNLGITTGIAVAATLLSNQMRDTAASIAERRTWGMHLSLLVGAGFAAVAAIASALRGPRQRATS